jgi:hypothetical protein
MRHATARKAVGSPGGFLFAGKTFICSVNQSLARLDTPASLC